METGTSSPPVLSSRERAALVRRLLGRALICAILTFSLCGTAIAAFSMPHPQSMLLGWPCIIGALAGCAVTARLTFKAIGVVLRSLPIRASRPGSSSGPGSSPRAGSASRAKAARRPGSAPSHR